MSVEISEIAKFLERTAPFASLTSTERAGLSRAVTVRYARSGDAILTAGEHNDSLLVIRSGAVELRLAGKDLTARLAAGSTFAYPSLLRGGEVRNTAIALEDTLLYAIPAERFHELRDQSAGFREFFADDEAARIRHALVRQRESSAFALDRRQVGDLVGRSEPVSCRPSTQIASAVQLMHERNVSTLAVCEDGKIEGIFTDKDLRSRVVASGVSLDRPVCEVMTVGPKTLGPQASVAEAMAMMASVGFRHIPLVESNGALAGILSATDILSEIGSNAIDTGMMIARSRSAEELIETASRVPESFASMVASGMHAATGPDQPRCHAIRG